MAKEAGRAGRRACGDYQVECGTRVKVDMCKLADTGKHERINTYIVLRFS